jgi:hypothetical protein
MRRENIPKFLVAAQQTLHPLARKHHQRDSAGSLLTVGVAAKLSRITPGAVLTVGCNRS